ncbi:MAG: LCP family protein [Anaerolineaceae bacterium]|jgi:LCP family protein required for cell wall assembly|nr:LCP family protein [Anaerolineaceae bacterium]
MRKGITLFFIIALLLSGCSVSTNSPVHSTVVPISDLLLNAGQKYLPSPTPFQPILPTATLLPTSTPKPTATPEENAPSSININLSRPKGQINILLLGSDWRSNQGYRTDVIMVLSLNPETSRVTITSFPRDLYVNIPGVGYERINAAQGYGGFALSQATFETNFDVAIDYYMMTSFTGFKNIIDTLGGINVYAAQELYDRCDLPQAVNKYCYIPVGTTTMNGATALWYVRSRYSTNDFDRTRRAQEVMLALFQKLMSLDAVNRSAELYDMFKSSVETNLPLDVIVKLLPLASKVISNPSIIERYAIGAAQTYDYIVPYTGAMVLIPDENLVGEIIQQAFYK